MATLLEQALAAAPATRKGTGTQTADSIALAIAWAQGKVGISQCEAALATVGVKKQSTSSYMLLGLKQAVKDGTLKVA